MKIKIMFCRLFYIFLLSFLRSFFFFIYTFYRVLSPYFILSYFYFKFKPRVFKQLWVAFRIFMWCEMYIIYVNVYIHDFFSSEKKIKQQWKLHPYVFLLSFCYRWSWWGGFVIWCNAFNTILVVCVLNRFVIIYFSRDLKKTHIFCRCKTIDSILCCSAISTSSVWYILSSKGYCTWFLIGNDIINKKCFN